METLGHFYLRALELEGRHPQDAGAWPVTYLRMEIGEGFPVPGSEWDIYTFPERAPFPPTRRPPPEVTIRHFYYRTIRSSAECERHLLLDGENHPQVFFHLTPDWVDPPGGMIPLPSATDIVFEQTHAARIIRCLPDRRLFHFQLLWRDWGDNGTGYMPYAYFDLRSVECWTTYGHPRALRLFREKQIDSQHVRWSAEDEEGHRLYGFDVRAHRSAERYAWAFVIEHDGALEVEELYVRPEHRRSGHGRWLADRVAQLAREKGMGLRVWVSFADCKEENEQNYPALVATARRLGVRFQPCPVRRAAYFATSDQPGEVFPPPPARVPMRPRLPRRELIALAAALGVGSAEPVPHTVPIASAVAGVNELAIGTPEWSRLTERRAELIYKKNREGLNGEEQAEYERLQARSQEVIARRFSHSNDLAEKLTALEKRLALREGAPEE